MKKLLILLCFSGLILHAQQTPPYLSGQTYTYAGLIKEYKRLDAISPRMKLFEYGSTDAGYPLHLLVISNDGKFVKPASAQDHKVVFLVMNGIHPGESEGIDASVKLARDIASGKTKIPDNLIMCIMPVYNVEGMLNRKALTRNGQNGPLEKGFRGSGCNYDLNRDFIKADSKNTLAFYEVFRAWDPDIFLDNHTSNGADYQYTMTLITTQRQKLGGKMADLLHDKLKPYLFAEMAARGNEMVPYVHVYGKSPDEEGYEEFIETPKYSSGFTALFSVAGFVAETHMLKPYADRVMATCQLMESICKYAGINGSEIRKARMADRQEMISASVYQTNFKLDRSKADTLLFRGFEAGRTPSKIGNYSRLAYNRDRPFIKPIPYYNRYTPELTISLPKAYIIPASWAHAIRNLKAASVIMNELKSDTVIAVNAPYITGYESSVRPNEGHHVNTGVKVQHRKQAVEFHKGDVIIYTRQAASRYIAEALEPECADGFFAWNFFDPVLNAKEGFSDYIFEDQALDLLASDTALNRQFNEWKIRNPEKLSNGYEVLQFIFYHSQLYEAEHNRIPAFRVEW